MTDLKFISSSGVEFDLHSFESAKLKTANFHKVEWEPEVIKKQYGTIINRFTKSAQIFDCSFYFRGTPANRKMLIDAFIFQTEMDIAIMKPGRIYWNNQYIDVFFNSHNCHPVDAGQNWTEIVGEFYAAFPFWIEEVKYEIDPDSPLVPGGGLPEDVKGYPMDRNISYAYTYSYPYGIGSGVFYVDSPIGADFNVVIYGPVSSVELNIAGNNYQVDYPLRTGQKLIVDSRDTLPLDKKCYVVNENGSETNVFDYRDPTSQLFKRLPGGEIVVYSATPYRMDITLFLERSAPI